MNVSWLTKTIFGLLATIALTSCGDDSELRWKEEVKLADGRIIVVTRRSEFKAPHEIGQPPGESHMWMEFEHPVTKEAVKFESKLVADSVEMVAAGAREISDPTIEHRPYALMLRGENLYAVTWLDASIDKFYGCPDPPFLLYLWQQGRWQRRPFEEIPQRKFVPNLSIDLISSRKTIKAINHYLNADQVMQEVLGHMFWEYDFTGMSQQTFDLPPNCSSCTMSVYLGNRADSPKAGPFCTRQQRDWAARKKTIKLTI